MTLGSHLIPQWTHVENEKLLPQDELKQYTQDAERALGLEGLLSISLTCSALQMPYYSLTILPRSFILNALKHMFSCTDGRPTFCICSSNLESHDPSPWLPIRTSWRLLRKIHVPWFYYKPVESEFLGVRPGHQCFKISTPKQVPGRLLGGGESSEGKAG